MAGFMAYFSFLVADEIFPIFASPPTEMLFGTSVVMMLSSWSWPISPRSSCTTLLSRLTEMFERWRRLIFGTISSEAELPDHLRAFRRAAFHRVERHDAPGDDVLVIEK